MDADIRRYPRTKGAEDKIQIKEFKDLGIEELKIISHRDAESAPRTEGAEDKEKN